MTDLIRALNDLSWPGALAVVGIAMSIAQIVSAIFGRR
jgi:hypothetical protein